MAKKLLITLKKSPLGRPENQRKTALALGFTKHQQTVEKFDSPTIRGMIRRISHLVEVVEQEG